MTNIENTQEELLKLEDAIRILSKKLTAKYPTCNAAEKDRSHLTKKYMLLHNLLVIHHMETGEGIQKPYLI